MTDLERFFRRLVGNLAGTDPARLHRPLPLADVELDILPYRANRRALEIDTSEDYEMVLLRLCAGEGGFVRTEPEEARTSFVQELQSPNPDLGVLRQFENVVLTLRSDPLARALGSDRDREASYAPPAPRLPDIPGLEELMVEVDEPTDVGPTEQSSVQCLYCGGALPAHRSANFCPHCGQSQTVPTCTNCHSELEPGWKHCINCGTAVGEG
ncbi:MAG: zinc ribbon domain-containing protein [Gemmatimonadales bacterium]